MADSGCKNGNVATNCGENKAVYLEVCSGRM